MNPFRDTIAEILMKEWKVKRDQKKKEEEKESVKWTSMSTLKDQPGNKSN